MGLPFPNEVIFMQKPHRDTTIWPGYCQYLLATGETISKSALSTYIKGTFYSIAATQKQIKTFFIFTIFFFFLFWPLWAHKIKSNDALKAPQPRGYLLQKGTGLAFARNRPVREGGNRRGKWWGEGGGGRWTVMCGWLVEWPKGSGTFWLNRQRSCHNADATRQCGTRVRVHLMIFASPLVKIISSASNWKLYKNNEMKKTQ